MRTTKELAALVEAAPDWEPQVDIHLGYRGAGDACEATWRAEVEAKEPVGVGLWQDPDADAQGCALGALLGALDRTTLRHLIAKADEADALRPLAEERDRLAAEVARLRPLAELGALALAWGRALRECAAARDAVKHATDLPAMLSAQNRAIDDAWDARAKLATAAMRMAEKEVGRG